MICSTANSKEIGSNSRSEEDPRDRLRNTVQSQKILKGIGLGLSKFRAATQASGSAVPQLVQLAQPLHIDLSALPAGLSDAHVASSRPAGLTTVAELAEVVYKVLLYAPLHLDRNPPLTTINSVLAEEGFREVCRALALDPEATATQIVTDRARIYAGLRVQHAAKDREQTIDLRDSGVVWSERD